MIRDRNEIHGPSGDWALLMIDRLRAMLLEPSVRRLDPDSPAFALAHRDVLRRKALLRRLFEGFYRECRALDLSCFGGCRGERIEIGSGSSFLREVFPDVLASDIKALPFLDLVARAESLPFPADSVRAVYAINVFHHLPRPRKFFEELIRVVEPGGGAVLIEPYFGPLARWVFRRLHASEGFDRDVPGWDSEACPGPMSMANQALSYVVLVRDREIWRREFPELELVLDRPHTHLTYLLSGGVNFRQLVPDCCGPVLGWAEKLLFPLNPILALQHSIVLRKRPKAGRAEQLADRRIALRPLS